MGEESLAVRLILRLIRSVGGDMRCFVLGDIQLNVLFRVKLANDVTYRR